MIKRFTFYTISLFLFTASMQMDAAWSCWPCIKSQNSSEEDPKPVWAQMQPKGRGHASTFEHLSQKQLEEAIKRSHRKIVKSCDQGVPRDEAEPDILQLHCLLITIKTRLSSEEFKRHYSSLLRDTEDELAPSPTVSAFQLPTPERLQSPPGRAVYFGLERRIVHEPEYHLGQGVELSPQRPRSLFTSSPWIPSRVSSSVSSSQYSSSEPSSRQATRQPIKITPRPSLQPNEQPLPQQSQEFPESAAV